MILFLHPNSQWWEARCDLRQRLATEAGIETVSVAAPRRVSCEWLADLAEIHNAQVIVNHCVIVPPKVFEEVARMMPDRTFIFVCHSSIPHITRGGDGVRMLQDTLTVTERNPNVYFATPDERNQIARLVDCDRVQWLPNPVGLTTHYPPRTSPPVVNPRIVLAGRSDPVKNYAHQIAACRLLRPCQVVAVLREHNRINLKAIGQTFHMPIRFEPFMPRAEWLDFLQGADLVLQVSHSESFNYVGIEALCSGVPVIGSPSLRYLPEDWQADPDDMDDIADKARAALGDTGARLRAAVIGHEFADKMDAAFIERLQSWIGEHG